MAPKLPLKITPCPIWEAIVEIRFDSDVEPDAIFGILYQKVKNEYPKVEKLPILQIPEAVRLQEPGLLQQPYYKLLCDNLSLRIGPKIFSVICTKEYIGWEKFSEILEKNFNAIDELKIVKKVKRFGVRYINFFEKTNIFDNIVVQITKNKKPLIYDGQHIKVTTNVDGIVNKMQIANNTRLIGRKNTGSVIDIDVSLKEPQNFFENKTKIIENCHRVEKESFFELLKKDFLKTLNPEY